MTTDRIALTALGRAVLGLTLIAVPAAAYAQQMRRPRMPAATVVRLRALGAVPVESPEQQRARLNAEQAAAAQAQNDKNAASKAAYEAQVAADKAAYEAAVSARDAEVARQKAEHDAAMAKWQADSDACKAGDRTRCGKPKVD